MIKRFILVFMSTLVAFLPLAKIVAADYPLADDQIVLEQICVNYAGQVGFEVYRGLDPKSKITIPSQFKHEQVFTFQRANTSLAIPISKIQKLSDLNALYDFFSTDFEDGEWFLEHVEVEYYSPHIADNDTDTIALKSFNPGEGAVRILTTGWSSAGRVQQGYFLNQYYQIGSALIVIMTQLIPGGRWIGYVLTAIKLIGPHLINSPNDLIEVTAFYTPWLQYKRVQFFESGIWVEYNQARDRSEYAAFRVENMVTQSGRYDSLKPQNGHGPLRYRHSPNWFNHDELIAQAYRVKYGTCNKHDWQFGYVSYKGPGPNEDGIWWD